MIDIHSHILWGLDDGAQSLEVSLEMLRIAFAAGTTDIVATPHANNCYTFDPALIEARREELASVNVTGLPRIHSGSDFHLSFANIEHVLHDPRPYTINHLRYLMVELPEDFIPPEIGTVFERMLHAGILPVITHPERNRALWRGEHLLEKWLELGCYSQITAQSLEGHFGRTAKRIAWRLLEENEVHFIASDGHDPQFRPPRLDRAYDLVSQTFSRETADLLLVYHPQRVLSGNPLPLHRTAVTPKPRFRLFGRK